MSARIIDGKAVAKRIRAECAERVQELHRRSGLTPGLAVILVGDDPASQVYVGNKIRACEGVGIKSQTFRYGRDVDTETILAKIYELNADAGVHGILVQLPMPPGVDTPRVIRAISVEKDVDGFHLYNVGGLVVGNTIFLTLHAIRRGEAARGRGRPDSRSERRRSRCQQHRRQAYGTDADPA
ncbi:MAG: tetrahydrofolate dehydrogenase/cyclohydrolase catalytic domain-containing protein [Chthoniobacteraceae bacterium]